MMSSPRTFAEAPEKSNFVQTCNLLSQYVKEKGSLRNLNIELGGKLESLESIVKPGSSLAASDSTAMANSHRFSTEKSVQQASVARKPSMESKPPLASPNSTIFKADDVSNKTSTSKDGANPAQLTIFYAGKVLVFDDYPENKLRELVAIAKKSSSQMSCGVLMNTVQEKPSPSPREGLPPRPQAAKGKATPSTAASASVASSSKSGGEQLSPQPEANGSDLPIARRSSLNRFLEKRKDRAAGRGPYHVHNLEQRASSSEKGGGQFDLNL